MITAYAETSKSGRVRFINGGIEFVPFILQKFGSALECLFFKLRLHFSASTLCRTVVENRKGGSHIRLHFLPRIISSLKPLSAFYARLFRPKIFFRIRHP